MAADAGRFLHQVRGAESQRHDSAGWLQQAGLNIRKASDAQHLEAIALAYATYIRISTSPLHVAIMAELETLSGRKRSRTTHDLHFIVERFVSCGGETPTERLAARKLISRDVRAIQHLESAKVLPSRVQVLAATPGQGLQCGDVQHRRLIELAEGGRRESDLRHPQMRAMGGDPDCSASKRAVIGSGPLFEEGVSIPSLTMC